MKAQTVRTMIWVWVGLFWALGGGEVWASPADPPEEPKAPRSVGTLPVRTDSGMPLLQDKDLLELMRTLPDTDFPAPTALVPPLRKSLIEVPAEVKVPTEAVERTVRTYPTGYPAVLPSGWPEPIPPPEREPGPAPPPPQGAVAEFKVTPVLSPPLRELIEKQEPQPPQFELIKLIPNRPLPRKETEDRKGGVDPAVQWWAPIPTIPTAVYTFEGVNNNCGCLPPDVEGDIGPNHYFEVVNLHFRVFDRAGTPLNAITANNTIWSGLTNCGPNNDGDPIVLYDPIADRWLVTQFAVIGDFVTNCTSYQCIAVSQTGDPLGSWWRAEFKHGLSANSYFGDYPKFGLWVTQSGTQNNNSYFMMVHQFGSIPFCGWTGSGFYAIQRDALMNGQSFWILYWNVGSVNTCFGGALPADLEGTDLPPNGTPGYFVAPDLFGGCVNPAGDDIQIWEFWVNWNCCTGTSCSGCYSLGPNNSGNPNQVIELSQTTCGQKDPDLCAATRERCIDQPGTNVKLEAISDRFMHALRYRRFPGYASMVVNHTVDAANNVGAPWWIELRKADGATSWTLRQCSVFSPNSLDRWMGSVSINAFEDMFLGYSRSGSTGSNYPSPAATGRLGTDTLSTMGTEAVLFAGNGSQTHSSGRWGDYTTTSNDPLDDCLWWHVNEYYSATSSASWQTRITVTEFPRYWAISRNRSGASIDALYDLRPLSNPTVDGYVAVGVTTWSSTDYDAWVLRPMPGCGLRYRLDFGGSGFDVPRSIVPTSDGGFLFVGYTESAGTNGAIWVRKLNGNGTTAWERIYDSGGKEFAYDVMEVTEGTVQYYVVVGGGQGSLGGFDIVVLKLDTNGNIVWQRYYGGSGQEIAYGVRRASDGRYLVVGQTSSAGAGSADGVILALNPDGTVAWQRVMGGPGHDGWFGVDLFSTGDIAISGWSHNGTNWDAWVVRLTSTGTLSWNRRIDGSADEIAYRGRVGSGDVFVVPVWYKGADSAAWVAQVASNGTVNWVRGFGGSGGDAAFVVQPIGTGYFVGGSTAAFGAGGQWDIWMLKTDGNGQIGTSCTAAFAPAYTSAVPGFTLNPATLSGTAASLVSSVGSLGQVSHTMAQARQCAAP